jgi:hypothetical protein
MMKLLEKNKAFDWTVECQCSFEELNKRLTSRRQWSASVDSTGFDQEVRHIL